jgi:hypothetical protein
MTLRTVISNESRRTLLPSILTFAVVTGIYSSTNIVSIKNVVNKATIQEFE